MLKHCVYIVQCSDNTLYTGYTSNLMARLKAHNSGKGAKYTRSRRPVTLVYFEDRESKSDAMSREFEIKKLSRMEKFKLIESRPVYCTVDKKVPKPQEFNEFIEEDMRDGRTFRDSKTICWDCENAYAHKCRKFSTSEPLVDIWEKYETYLMKVKHGVDFRKVVAFVVLDCKNFKKDERIYRNY